MDEGGQSGQGNRILSDLQVGTVPGCGTAERKPVSSPPGQNLQFLGLTETERVGEKEGWRHRQEGSGPRAGHDQAGSTGKGSGCPWVFSVSLHQPVISMRFSA